MKFRTYIFWIGVILLTGLYLELPWILYGLMVVLVLQGIGNLRIAQRCQDMEISEISDGGAVRSCRVNFEAERVWNIALALVLFVTYVPFHESLWFVPWFQGFAITGAGLSGVCPLYLLSRKLGFK